MAVSMNAASMRADFMISDAALPQRFEELAEEQAGMFAQLLSGIGDAKGDLAVEVEEVVQKYSDMKDAVEAAIYRDKETGMPLPEDPKKLATLIVKGKVKLKNVPAELITPELMKLLMLMKKAGEFGKDDEDDEDKDSLFDPVDAIAAEQKFQQELSNSMLMELYRIIEKHNERESEDKVTMLDGISEPIDPTETLPSVVTAEEEPAMGESMFTELIDNLVESVTEGLEVREEDVKVNTDVFVPSETIKPAVEAAETVVPNRETVASEVKTEPYAQVEAPVLREAPVSPKTPVQQEVKYVRVSEVPAENRVTETVSFEAAIPDATAAETTVTETTAANVTVTEAMAVNTTVTERTAVNITVAEATVVEAKVPEATVLETEVPGIESEVMPVQPEKVITEQTISDKAVPAEQITVTRTEQPAEVTAEQTIPDTRAEVRPAEQPETVRNAAQRTETDQPTVKVVTQNDNAEQLDKAPQEAPKSTDIRTERVKSATEELEMLRNAKAKTTKPVIEEKLEVKPERTPLNTDSPVVIRKADGTEIEVRPSEIVKQAAKLVEKAITENDDKTEYSLVLNPEELGKITVKLTKAADGAISVTIAAENAKTQRILEQNSSLMQDNLRSNGVNLESWQTVNERQQETLAQDYNGSSKNPYYRNDDGSQEENSDDKSFADIIASM